MQTRLTSSLAVVGVGVLTTVIGGPLFAVFLVFLGIAGFREYSELARRVLQYRVTSLAPIGFGVISALGITALFAQPSTTLFAIVAIAVASPLVVFCLTAAGDGAFAAWSAFSSGSLYLGLPVFAAITLRTLPGGMEPAWVPETIRMLRFGWEAAPRGLAWTLTTVLATWVGDSAAYLAGGSFGRYKLAPKVSPNKTIEGAVAGLLGAATVGGISFFALGLGPLWRGVFVGAIIGASGQVGDLAESFLKRQAGVKDSGSLIPGHGGVLDRIDALLFAFPAGLLLASGDQWLLN